MNTNHNQMGKLSNSGKSLVEEKEKFHRGKRTEGGRAAEGWDFILTQTSFFSLGMRGRLYVILKMRSLRLLERNSKPFFFLIQQPQQQQAVEIVRQSHSREIFVKWLLIFHITSMINSTSKVRVWYSKTFALQANGKDLRTFDPLYFFFNVAASC